MAIRMPILSTAAALIPEKPSLTELREIAAGCQACDLWQKGTQTVFGAGSTGAKLLFVGEQPGNDEDLAGQPFVGPAGELLDTALEAAGIDRNVTYVTNVVKHFKWEPRGKRRIHAKPNAAEVTACLPWLEAELRLVQPELIICLGATAAQALLGKKFRVTQQRGKLIESPYGHAMATVHPSSILRAPDDEARGTEMKLFISDLKTAAKWLEAHEKSYSGRRVS
jgi:DNA polymerase